MTNAQQGSMEMPNWVDPMTVNHANVHWMCHQITSVPHVRLLLLTMTSTLLHPNNTDVMLVPMVMKVLSVKDVQMVTMGILSLLVTTANHVDVTLMRTSVIHDTVITLLVNV